MEFKLLGQKQNPNCTDCPLHKSSKHVCIMGRGNPKAKIFLIGEAPGSAEELTGKPFMGRAGKLLNHLLEELGIQDDVYISNVCKCRPPENRKPTYDEVKICCPYLIHELHTVVPEVIVLLGKAAMQFVDLKRPLAKDRLSAASLPIRFKYFYALNDVLVIPTWHPAYCLRRGTGATNDLRKALKIAKIKAHQ